MDIQIARMPVMKTSLIDALSSLICWIKIIRVNDKIIERNATVEYPNAIRQIIVDIDIPVNTEIRRAFLGSVMTFNNPLPNGSFSLSPSINVRIFSR